MGKLLGKTASKLFEDSTPISPDESLDFATLEESTGGKKTYNYTKRDKTKRDLARYNEMVRRFMEKDWEL